MGIGQREVEAAQDKGAHGSACAHTDDGHARAARRRHGGLEIAARIAHHEVSLTVAIDIARGNERGTAQILRRSKPAPGPAKVPSPLAFMTHSDDAPPALRTRPTSMSRSPSKSPNTA